VPRPSELKRRLMTSDDLEAALQLARQTLGFRAVGRPIDDAPETAVRLARLVASLCHHIESTEELAAQAEAERVGVG
jgi:hypothetical protein